VNASLACRPAANSRAASSTRGTSARPERALAMTAAAASCAAARAIKRQGDETRIAQIASAAAQISAARCHDFALCLHFAMYDASIASLLRALGGQV